MAEPGPDLSKRDIEKVNLIDSRVRGLWLANAKVTGAWLMNATIDGDVEGLIMNGVEVGPLIDAELRKRHPILANNDPRSADKLRQGIEDVYAIWDALEARAGALGESAMQTRVDDEWSFVETIRHLIYATDCWFRRGVLDEDQPNHALGLTHAEAHGQVPGIDDNATPTYAEVLAARRENQAALRAFAATLTDESVLETNNPKTPGHPYGDIPVGEALSVIVNEEFWHSTYAERDLNALTSQ